ncbi:hypothetical protein G7072_04305 [Nocardioides sp. HDW12B]|uniref:hypothetical protein n=1 Tax=Nocardioides sp. HDW12B TaxID=2714939 RepID=UPI00140A1D9F|nr:hypothetical protein [Nocardioides sp. HDW12B]QIK65664.1 hypothetical protein G7072_04305 [Nocardioides sp. HDW12B]
MRTSEPDPRVLGRMALGLAVLSLVLAATYFFSPLAYLVGALAVVLGLVSRTDVRSRSLGTVTLVIAAAAIALPTVAIFSI